LPQQRWEEADAIFTREPSNRWIKKTAIASPWVIEHESVRFKLMPTDFGHIGIFPEHAMLWKWFQSRIDRKSTILNLFAYTGGATLAAALKGAEVCHVDASKAAVAWARENSMLNGLDKAPIRWIVDDVIKFLKREVKRGRLYTGILLDPPTFGRGNKGEVFKIERDLADILELCFSLLSNEAPFLILSSHTPGYTPLVLKHLIQEAKAARKGTIEIGELTVPGPFELPSGTYARWYA
jgi:23S rRNA (cytosine1962-C5)-methyltransferase